MGKNAATEMEGGGERSAILKKGWKGRKMGQNAATDVERGGERGGEGKESIRREGKQWKEDIKRY